MFKQGHANGDSQQDNQHPYPPLRLSPLGLVTLAMQKPCPLTLRIEAAIAMDPIELVNQSIKGAAMDLPQRAATDRA
jgi:hypothetical protein